MAMSTILNFLNPLKSRHTLRWIFLSLPWKRPNCLKKNEKHKNDNRRLLAKQKLMKLDRKNIEEE
jgi:hypothetical protein